MAFKELTLINPLGKCLCLVVCINWEKDNVLVAYVHSVFYIFKVDKRKPSGPPCLQQEGRVYIDRS